MATRRPPPAFVKALLRNPYRAQIMALLKRNPGMNKHRLSKLLDVHVNAIEFHVARLADADLLELRPGTKGREQLCFTKDDVALWDDPATRILYGRGPPRDVATYLAEHPGTGAQDVADALGVSVHTVRRHIRTLEENDLVQRMRVDRQVLYHAEPELVDWVEWVQGNPRNVKPLGQRPDSSA